MEQRKDKKSGLFPGSLSVRLRTLHLVHQPVWFSHLRVQHGLFCSRRWAGLEGPEDEAGSERSLEVIAIPQERGREHVYHRVAAEMKRKGQCDSLCE